MHARHAGARIHAFITDSGYQIDFLYKGMPASDYEFLIKRRAQNHDIEHMVTGLCPSKVGEVALIAANSIAKAKYVSTEFEHELNLHGTVLMFTLSRSGLDYPATLPSLLEGISRGHRLGSKQARPLLMIRWEDHLNRPPADIRENLASRMDRRRGIGVGYFRPSRGKQLRSRFCVKSMLQYSVIKIFPSYTLMFCVSNGSGR